jgi:hypothetical protein
LASFSRYIFITLSLFLALSSGAQDTTIFKLDWKKDAILLGTGGIAAGVGFAGRKSVDAYSEVELASLSTPDLWNIDKGAIKQWSTASQDVSDVLLISSIATPILLLGSYKCRSQWKEGVVMYAETMLLTYGITDMIKSGVKRDRPLVYNPLAPLSEKTAQKARLSFVSGHSSMSAASCVFTATVLAQVTQNDRWDPLILGAGFGIPAVVAVLRVEGGKHYPTDVIAGYTLGALIGYAVPRLHRKKRDGNVSLGLGAVQNQTTLQLTWSPR